MHGLSDDDRLSDSINALTDRANAAERDVIALETIHKILDGKEWNSDTMNLVADQVRITGRIVEDVNE